MRVEYETVVLPETHTYITAWPSPISGFMEGYVERLVVDIPVEVVTFRHGNGHAEGLAKRVESDTEIEE